MRCLLKTLIAGYSETTIHLVLNQHNTGRSRNHRIRGPIGRSVVNDNNLRALSQRPKAHKKVVAGVVADDDGGDRKFWQRSELYR